MRTLARWLFPLVCYGTAATYALVLAAGVVAQERLGHWPRGSIDDPKYERILGAYPFLYELALSAGVALWLGVLSAGLPLCVTLLAFAARPASRWRLLVPLTVFAITCVLAIVDVGGTICWLLD